MQPTSTSNAPSVYVLYGTPGCGRADVVLELVETLLDGGESVAILLPEDCQHARDLLADKGQVTCIPWQLKDCTLQLDEATPISHSVVLIVAPGLAHPADMAEAVKSWLAQSNRSIARILTLVDCAKAAEHGRLRTWLEAWIHFSDAVLLNHRENVAQKWLQEFEKHFQKLCYPCRFFNVKKGRLRNPNEVLEPEPRRISLYFDELEPIEEDDLEEEDLPEDLAEDPYIARLESGQRAKNLPPIDKLFS